MADRPAGDWPTRQRYEIADPRLWIGKAPIPEEKTVKDKAKVTQGKAVAKALAGKRDEDIDGWNAFSPSDANALAQAPAAPKDAIIPRAGLARNGGKADRA